MKTCGRVAVEFAPALLFRLPYFILLDFSLPCVAVNQEYKIGFFQVIGWLVVEGSVALVTRWAPLGAVGEASAGFKVKEIVRHERPEWPKRPS